MKLKLPRIERFRMMRTKSLLAGAFREAGTLWFAFGMLDEAKTGSFRIGWLILVTGASAAMFLIGIALQEYEN